MRSGETTIYWMPYSNKEQNKEEKKKEKNEKKKQTNNNNKQTKVNSYYLTLLPLINNNNYLLIPHPGRNLLNLRHLARFSKQLLKVGNCCAKLCQCVMQ